MTEIRSAHADETDNLAQFYHDMWHESQAPFQDKRIADFRDLRFMRARINEFFPHIFVATNGNQIEGLMVAHNDRLSQLFIHPKTRGQGLGANLLALGEAKMMAEGTVIATLSCIKGNDGARRFYERHDWTVFDEHSKMGETHQGWVAPVHIWEMRKTLK